MKHSISAHFKEALVKAEGRINSLLEAIGSSPADKKQEAIHFAKSKISNILKALSALSPQDYKSVMSPLDSYLEIDGKREQFLSTITSIEVMEDELLVSSENASTKIRLIPPALLVDKISPSNSDLAKWKSLHLARLIAKEDEYLCACVLMSQQEIESVIRGA